MTPFYSLPSWSKPWQVFLFPFLVTLIALPVFSQTIRYVSSTGTNTNPASATSWATSTTDLQGAINASASGDQVWVKSGLYKPTTGTDRTLSFAMKNGVAIYGGFVGTETILGQRSTINLTTPSGTTLSGEIGSPGSTTDNSYHIIRNSGSLTTTALLDGFVITAGFANGSFPDNAGAGLYNPGGSPSIRNCVFVNNTVTYLGGGVYANGSPILTNCAFWSNSAQQGGAIGSTGSSPMFINCLVQNNRATDAGGAFYNFSSNPILTNCSFQSNTATAVGGVFSNQAQSNVQLTNCSFMSNIASQGGVMYNFNSTPTITNCVAFGNGGANTFFSSTSATSVSARYSLFEASVTGYASITGNLTTTLSPFASTISTELPPCSPAIDAGDPATTSATIGTTDLAGNPRFYANGRVDMGAYEFQDNQIGPISPPLGSSFTICAGQSIGLSASLSDFSLQLCGAIANKTPVSTASFGPSLTATAINGPIKFLGQLTEVDQGCTPYPPDIFSGKVALIRRGTCSFSIKVKNAQNAGAIGVLIFNNISGNIIGLGGTDATITIPSAGINQVEGEAIAGALATGEVQAKTQKITYNWLPTTGLNASTGASVIASPTQTTAYTVTASILGVTGSQTVITLAITPAPSITITASPSLTFTPGQSVTLTASGASSYTWNTGLVSNVLVIPATSTSQYSVTGLTASCAGSASVVINGPVCGTVIYVTQNGAGSQNGSSWASAIAGTGLQTALNTATSCGAQVWVAAGTYKPTATTDHTVSFVLPSGVSLYGGFPNTGNPTFSERNPAANPTILSGDIDGVPDVVVGSGRSLTITGNAGNSRHVVYAENVVNTRLDGFVITGGNATTAAGNIFASSGGGMLYLASQPGLAQSLTVSNCTFTGNMASGDGGGISMREFYNTPSIFLVTSCTLTNNIANSGAGMYSIYSTSIVNQLTDCVLTGNKSGLGGGAGLYGIVQVNRCRMVGNYASLWGGGISASKSITIINTVVQSNTTISGGSGINFLGSQQAMLINCQISGNTSLGSNGVITNEALDFPTRLTLINSTIANNTSGAIRTKSNSTSFTATTILKNTIVANNTSGNFLLDGTGASLQSQGYNLDSDGTSGFTNGVNGDRVGVNPGFVSNTDLRLQVGSPAINAGDPTTTTATVGATDLAGNPRFYANGRIDMGAYEYQDFLEVFTLKDGLWSDPTVWSVSRLPQAGDRVRLKHTITIPAGLLALAGGLIYDSASRLIYSADGRLQLNP